MVTWYVVNFCILDFILVLVNNCTSCIQWNSHILQAIMTWLKNRSYLTTAYLSGRLLHVWDGDIPACFQSFCTISKPVDKFCDVEYSSLQKKPKVVERIVLKLARDSWHLHKLIYSVDENVVNYIIACTQYFKIIWLLIYHQKLQINVVKSRWNESALILIRDLFLLEPLHPWWMNVHRRHESQASQVWVWLYTTQWFFWHLGPFNYYNYETGDLLLFRICKDW